MSGSVLAIVIVVAVLVVAAIAFAIVRSSRRRKLRDRFGPEYDHTVENADSRRDAERDLRARAAQRDEVDIHELTPAAAARYQEQWQLVQQQFVDEPIPAVRDAQTLVTRVMNERGYPTSTEQTRAAMLSVDHAGVMDNFRAATAIEARSGIGNATTEELRQAMQHYRAIFDRLLGDVTVLRGSRGGPDA
jgi:hypothetical protein